MQRVKCLKVTGIFIWSWLAMVPCGIAQQMVFPGAEWETATPESLLVDSAKLQSAISYLETNSPPNGVEALAIIRNGRMMWGGPGIDRMHSTASAVKSVTSTVLGLLIDDGMVMLDTPVKDYVPVLAEDYPDATLRHFATMTSGYRPAGTWSKWGWTSTPFTPSTPWFEPGSQFFYQDPMMEQLARALTQVAQEPLEAFFQRRIADPIGMDRTQWDWWDFSDYNWSEYEIIDGFVHNLGSDGMNISAREAARFGHLFLNRGEWDGQQLISTAWVDEATKVQVPATVPRHPLNPSPGEGLGEGPGVYGYNWWINGVTPAGSRLLPGATPGTYYAHGIWNNYIFVVPEWNMVIIRLGNDGEGSGAVEGGFEIPSATWGAFFSQLGSVGLTVAWDGNSDGDWGDIDSMTGKSRWLDENNNAVSIYPDDSLSGAVIRSNIVTVASDRTVRDLTIEDGGLRVLSSAKMSIEDDLTIQDEARCVFQLDEASSGSIAVAGDVSLDGTLEVQLAGGFTPLLGDTFDIITATAVEGTFDIELLPTLMGDLKWIVDYQANGLSLLAALSGDFDSDSDVDGADFLMWQRGEVSNPPNAEDLALWEAHFGTTSTLSSSTSIPEPSSFVLLLAAFACSLPIQRLI